MNIQQSIKRFVNLKLLGPVFMVGLHLLFMPACSSGTVAVDEQDVVDTRTQDLTDTLSDLPADDDWLSDSQTDTLVPCETGEPCDDNNPCTDNDMCKGGYCSGQPYSCDDNLTCTKDTCLGKGECSNTLRSGFCFIQETCYEEGDSNPENACQQCITSVSKSEFSNDNNNPCDDNNPCTVQDRCIAGTCTGSPKPCEDDSNPCTQAVCTANGVCSQEYVEGPCQDSDPCTSGETCSNGQCVPSETWDCNDNNPCTDDTCIPGLGCRNIPNSNPCEDNNKCTLNDVCQAGACAPGTNIQICNDNNPCTDDTCHPELGCLAFPNNGPCDDGDPCLEGDFCAAGTCQPGVLQITCTDDNPCTDTECIPFAGCNFPPNDAQCDDLDPCTLNDFCQNTVCVGGPGSLDCNDNNLCTADSCTPFEGCLHTNLSNIICSDDSVCTDYDKCVNGTCVGIPHSCDDGNACTADSCDPDLDCINTVINSPECRPQIIIFYPPRGVTLTGDPIVPVTGQVTSAAAPVENLTLNGTSLSLGPNGEFSMPVQAGHGMNLLMTEAHDQLGGVGKSVQSFYYSTQYYPIDVANPAQSMVTDGLMIFLGKDVWDDNDTSDMDDIATILTLYLQNMDLNSMITNPVTSTSVIGCNYDLSVYNISFGIPIINLVPVDGGLSLAIILPNFSADIKAESSQLLCPDATGTATASKVNVAATVLVSINSGGNVSVLVQNMTVSLTGFGVDLDGLTGFLLNWIIDLFEGTIQTELEAALKDQLQTMLPQLLTDVLSSLALNTAFEVAPFLGSGDPINLNINTGLSSINFKPEGATMGMKATVVTPKNITHSPLGSIGRASCLSGAPEIFAFPQQGQLEMALHDDLINQAAFGIYWGGLLNLDLTGAELGADLAQYGVQDLIVHIDALLPPILSSCTPDGQFVAQLGDVRIDASMTFSGLPITLTAYASLEVEATLVAVDGVAGKELSVSIGDVRVFEIEITEIQGALVGAEDALIGLLKDNLVGGLLGGLAGGALGSFPIPAIDLSSFDPNLPPGSMIEIDLQNVLRIVGYNVLSGNVK